MTVSLGKQDATGLFSIVRKDPMQMSFATQLIGFSTRQVLLGDKGFTLTESDSVAIADLDSTQVLSLRAQCQSDLVHLLRTASLPNSEPVVRGRQFVGRQECDLVEFLGLDGLRWRLAIARVSHRVLAADGLPDDEGHWIDHRVFSDFRLSGGYLLPFTEERSVNGERTAVYRCKLAAVNQETPAGLFHRPHVVHGQIVPD